MVNEEEQGQYALGLEDTDAVNLDEVTTKVVSVAFKIPGGWKHVEVDTYVPMSIFHRVLATHKKVQKLKDQYDAAEEHEEDEKDPMVEWMMKQILTVWKLQDPEMTMERLEYGLNFTKAQALFQLFFGEITRQNANKASTESNGIEESRPTARIQQPLQHHGKDKRRHMRGR